jgi:hypothetical protein
MVALLQSRISKRSLSLVQAVFVIRQQDIKLCEVQVKHSGDGRATEEASNLESKVY